MNDISKKTGSLDFACPSCKETGVCELYNQDLEIHEKSKKVPASLLTEMSLCSPEKNKNYHD